MVITFASRESRRRCCRHDIGTNMEKDFSAWCDINCAASSPIHTMHERHAAPSRCSFRSYRIPTPPSGWIHQHQPIIAYPRVRLTQKKIYRYFSQRIIIGCCRCCRCCSETDITIFLFNSKSHYGHPPSAAVQMCVALGANFSIRTLEISANSKVRINFNFVKCTLRPSFSHWINETSRPSVTKAQVSNQAWKAEA